MSWTHFGNLITNTDARFARWEIAIDANPNTPEDALRRFQENNYPKFV